MIFEDCALSLKQVLTHKSSHAVLSLAKVLPVWNGVDSGIEWPDS
jgi:hypothetical protein